MKRVCKFIVAMSAVLFSPMIAGAQELSLFAWSEYVPQSVLDGFTKETGIKVTYETYASNEEMVTKLVAGGANYDLVIPSEYTVEALKKQSLLAELDHAKIPNLKNVQPSYMNLAYDQGNKVSVPWMAGTVGIVYNGEKIKDPITGFKDIFQDKYKKRLVVLDDAREFASWVMVAQGIDVNAVTKDNLAKIRPQQKQWMDLVRSYDSDSPKTALQSGDVDIGVVWNGEGSLLIQDDPKFKWVLPQEGAHKFIDSLCVPKNAKNKEAAHKFINYVLKPEVGKEIWEAFPYTTVNVESKKLLSDEQRGNLASFPANEDKLKLFTDIGEVMAEVEKQFSDLKGQ
ncbi:MAG: spermidine/putrescine ABC transporter substrate-binding protein [Burkholderiales bacterium]|nr:spermidine/putrescine ABC transporter substrate-binding protein [Phycisphaerae bacterium]